MRKIDILFLIIFLCLNLGGCVKKEDQRNRWTGSDHDMSDQIMEEIVSALDARDVDALKKQFSEEAVKEVINLDENITNLMEFYQGTMVDFSGTVSTGTSIDHGKVTSKSFISDYTLVTDKITYQVTFSHKPIDKDNPEKIGLSQLELVSQETFDKQVEEIGTYTWKCGEQGMGVYYTK